MSVAVLGEQDMALVRVLQQDVPLMERPFEDIGNRIGMREEEILQKVRAWKIDGTIRRFGALLRHRQLGIKANAMVVWEVDAADASKPDRTEEVGRIMASFPEVTHCYERPRLPGWPFTLFTMVHGRTPEECERVAKRISEETGVGAYRLIYSTREWKKTDMKYF